MSGNCLTGAHEGVYPSLSETQVRPPVIYNRRLIGALVLVCAVTTGVPQQGNPSSSPEPNSPTVRVQTRLVMVDVVARDKSGKVVTDLAVDDFKVLENG